MASDVLFESFDDAAVFHRALGHTKSFSSLNFVLDFNSATARYAPDISVAGFQRLIAERKAMPEVG